MSDKNALLYSGRQFIDLDKEQRRIAFLELLNQCNMGLCGNVAVKDAVLYSGSQFVDLDKEQRRIIELELLDEAISAIAPPSLPFTPNDITGKVAWLFPGRGTMLNAVSPNIPASPGNAMRRWIGLVGGINVDQSTAANQPTRTQSRAIKDFSSTSNGSHTSGGSGDDFDPDGSPFSWFGWVKPTSNTSTNVRAIVGKWDTAAKRTFLLGQAGTSSLRVRVDTSRDGNTQDTTTSSNDMLLNKWNSVGFSYTPSTGEVLLRVNGVNTTATHTTGNLFSSTTTVQIGNRVGASVSWLGSIGPLAYWKGVALSSAQFDILRASGFGLPFYKWPASFSTSLICALQYENGYFRDVSGNGNHFTKNGTGLTMEEGPFTIIPPVAYFSGAVTTQSMAWGADPGANQPFQVYAALRAFADPGTNRKFFSLPNARLEWSAGSVDKIRMRDGAGGAAANILGQSGMHNAFHKVAMHFDGTSSWLNIDGTVSTDGTQNFTSNIDNVIIGDTASSFEGILHELILVQGAEPSAALVTNIFDYLDRNNPS